ncbi:MAG: DnaA/Hda family protein [Hyphomonas sp.]|uniref:hypothetical protein n=1 Tax=Hyphomonas sp. TaxID=87 RepID=UPI003528D640
MSFAFPEAHPGFERLVVTQSNRPAISIVRQADKWPMPVLCLVGPLRSGRTAILSAWCSENDGKYVQAKDMTRLKPAQVTALASGKVALDDAEDAGDGEALLSLLNQLGAQGGRLLLASSRSPSQWLTSSADLKSRLNSMPIAEIQPPDEAMLQGRLQAAAGRHFMKLEDDVIAYLSPRLDLSYEAIEAFVEKLSHGVTSTGRAPSVPLAKEVLEAMGLATPDQPPLL